MQENEKVLPINQTKKKINKAFPMESPDTALIRQRVTRVFRYVQTAKGNDI